MSANQYEDCIVCPKCGHRDEYGSAYFENVWRERMFVTCKGCNARLDVTRQIVSVYRTELADNQGARSGLS